MAEDRLAAEQRARVTIDGQLSAAGWLVQDRKSLNLFAGRGIAVREVVMAKGHGRVDYLLYVDEAAVGVIVEKPVGTTLSGVEWQSAMYAEGLPVDAKQNLVSEYTYRSRSRAVSTWTSTAREIVEDLTAALAQFEAVASALEASGRIE